MTRISVRYCFVLHWHGEYYMLIKSFRSLKRHNKLMLDASVRQSLTLYYTYNNACLNNCGFYYLSVEHAIFSEAHVQINVFNSFTIK